MEEGRQVLVFSQFVQMLRLMEPELKRRNWAFRILTGETEDRQEPVTAFQGGEGIISPVVVKGL